MFTSCHYQHLKSAWQSLGSLLNCETCSERTGRTSCPAVTYGQGLLTAEAGIQSLIPLQETDFECAGLFGDPEKINQKY